MIRRIARLDLHLALRADVVEEFEWVVEREASSVPAGRAKAGEWEIHYLIKLEFQGNDFVVFAAGLAPKGHLC